MRGLKASATRLVIFSDESDAVPLRRMLMTVAVMVVPDGAVVAGVGFEEEAGGGEGAGGFGGADGAGGGIARLRDRAFEIEFGLTHGAGVAVAGHYADSATRQPGQRPKIARMVQVRLESEGVAHIVAQGDDRRVVEIDDRSAFGADQVMMRLVVDQLVLAYPLPRSVSVTIWMSRSNLGSVR